MIIRTSVITVLKNKEQPRLWLEGQYLKKAGFTPNTMFSVTYLYDRIEINQTNKGSGLRHVSFKKNLIPVIDINNSRIRDLFNIGDKAKVITKIGQIIFTLTKKIIRKFKQLHDKSVGEVFSGGGLLSQAAKEAGFTSKWAIESNEDYAEVWQANHPGIMFNSDIAEVNFDELSQVELLIGGIPCEPFSVLRRNQGNKIYEEHKNADLSMFFLMVVEKVNPRTIILEEVPPYIKSGIGIATMSALRRMGYNVDYRIFSGNDFGELEIRKRVCIVATTGDKIVFPELTPRDRTMNEILDNEDPDCEWFTRETKSWFFEHIESQRAKGNSFSSQIINSSSKSIQAIPKRYFAIQTNNPIVAHPTIPGMYRLLTPKEVKRLKGINEDYQFPLSKTKMGEVINQGVIIPIFRRIIESVMQQ